MNRHSMTGAALLLAGALAVLPPSAQAAETSAAAAGLLEATATDKAAHAPTQARERANKALVHALTQQMLSDTALHRLGAYFAGDLIQHDPKLANGRAAMLAWIGSQRAQSPAQTLTIKHLLADHDLVFVHSHVSATPDNEFSGTNRYDLYRVDRGVIVEHWAYRSGVRPSSASGNSTFSDLYVYETPPTPSEEREDMHRLLVKTLSEEVFGKRNFGLLDRFWAEGYLQHNPYVGNGRAALAEVLEYIAPVGSHYRVTHSVADDDLTLVCAHAVDPGMDPADEFSGAAVCDIFRVANLELVEHWDVAQAVPATSVNGNSMFSSLYRRR